MSTPHPASRALRSDRVFVIGEKPPDDAPNWLPKTLDSFSDEVGNRDYPCYFGYRAIRDGELFATWVDPGDDGEGLALGLQDFLDASRAHPRSRLVLAAFFAPDQVHRQHEWYGDLFWSVLRGLQRADCRPRPPGFPVSPEDPEWEFTFGGEAMFVFAAAPTHDQRRSRHLGDGLVMLFQPRNVFRRIEGGTPGGTAARHRIRSKLAEWDSVPPHPVMGDYGDESNFEWKQYFVGDHELPLEPLCPLDPSTEDCLHTLVSEQARRTPDDPAVICGGVVLDYRTLDRRSEALARRLTDKGVRPEDRLAVVADRSVDTVVAMLAVLKSGAAYLPLDPAYPEDRRAFLLEDAGVDVVVSPRRAVSSVPVGPRWILLSDDELHDDRSAEDVTTTTVRPQVRPDNLAYVIYTSGSTGRPKGVAVAHRQIVASTRAQYAVDRPWPEAFLMPISFSFDASAVGVYWTLTRGGCLVLPTDGEHRDPDELRTMITQYAITHIDCTPALWDLILTDDPTPLLSLRSVQVGGETCPPALVRRHMAALPGCVLQNNYGPTETTIWSTTKLLGPKSSDIHEPVSIGRPIPGARVHLLGADLEPVADGVEAEMFVGGQGVARGYLGLPSLTAERFVPDPFSARPGSRMYRTGDLARQRPDGELDFIGRIDTQVKVRGFRIELGEIESALRGHPTVSDVAVLVQNVADEPVLVGYVQTTRGGDWPSYSSEGVGPTLTAHLAARLPDYMVPRRWVVVASIPRTISGKLDLQQLNGSTPPTTGPTRSPAEAKLECPVLTATGAWSR